jgi:hypothetical protein
VYAVSSGVRSTNNNKDGGIVLDINSAKIFRLNGIGAFIFERIRDRRNETEIIAEVSHEFGIPDATVRADVVDFLKSLEHEGLIVASLGL